MTSLTIAKIKNAIVNIKFYKLSDRDGLYLLVKPNGAKLWRYNYRYLNKQKTLAIGKFPELSLADAREKHREARRLLAQDLAPSA